MQLIDFISKNDGSSSRMMMALAELCCVGIVLAMVVAVTMA